jgi:hypothetical protein
LSQAPDKQRVRAVSVTAALFVMAQSEEFGEAVTR